MDKEIPALYAIEYTPFTGFALTAFPVFFLLKFRQGTTTEVVGRTEANVHRPIG